MKINFLSIIKIPFQAARMQVILFGAAQILLAAVPLIQIGVTANFLDAAADIDGGRYTVFYWLAALISLLLLKEIASCLDTLALQYIEIQTNKLLEKTLLEKISNLKYFYIEDNDSQNLITRVKNGLAGKIQTGFSAVWSMFNLAVRVIGVIGIILTGAAWSACLLVLFLIILSMVSAKAGKANYSAEKDVTEKSRKVGIISNILTSREALDERYIFSYTDHMQKVWRGLFEDSLKYKFKIEKKWFIRMKAAGVLITLLSVLIFISLLLPAARGQISPGLFIALINAVLTIIQDATWNFTSLVDSLAQVHEFLKDYRLFCELEDEKSEKEGEGLPSGFEFKTLVFDDVTFSYPGRGETVLSNLSFSIEKGKKYAFVGTNGSGKTTIVKLILGLYDNYSGKIFVNGTDIKSISKKDRKQIFSVVFQDFLRYQISIKDNIQLGSDKVLSDEKIYQIAEECGLGEKVRSMEDGIETELGKIGKDGVDVSGGEWQKLAIGRSMAADTPVCILDEPAASLDPVSESELYHKILSVSKDRTVILISHRLASTTLADMIFVLEQGNIREAGSCEELLGRRGLYYRMFEGQRKWYDENGL